MPNLGLSSGAISTNLGKYVYVLSGVNAEEVYECAGKIIEKMRENPGFASINSDLYLKNPQLSVNFNRDHFYKFGVNVNKAENILKQAFSENYCYQKTSSAHLPAQREQTPGGETVCVSTGRYKSTSFSRR